MDETTVAFLDGKATGVNSQSDYFLEKDNHSNIGKMIRAIRGWLAMSQEEFAKCLILNSRIPICNVEKTTNNRDIPTEFLMRVFYYTVSTEEEIKKGGGNTGEGYFGYLIKQLKSQIIIELNNRKDS